MKRDINVRTFLAYATASFSDLDSKRSTHGDSLYVLDGVRGFAALVVMLSHTAAFGMKNKEASAFFSSFSSADLF